MGKEEEEEEGEGQEVKVKDTPGKKDSKKKQVNMVWLCVLLYYSRTQICGAYRAYQRLICF